MDETLPISGPVHNEDVSKPLSKLGDCALAARMGVPNLAEDPRDPQSDNFAVCEVLGGPLFERFHALMHQIEIAEELLHRASEIEPQFAARFDSAFVMLRWCLPVAVTDVVYRAHIDELLNRIGRNESLEAGTRAEVLILLCTAGVHKGLSSRSAALFAQLFEQLFGKPLPGSNDSEHPADTTGTHDLFVELSRRLAQSWRKVKAQGDHTC